MFSSHQINFARFSSLLLAATIGMGSAGCHAASGGGIASGARDAFSDKEKILVAVFEEPSPDAQAPSLVHDASCIRIQRGVDREVADTQLSKLRDNANYGLDPSSRIGAANAAEHQTLVAFDLQGIPRGAKVLYAAMSLVRRTGGRAQMTVHRITQDWSEHEATWHSFDNAYESNAEATVHLGGASIQGRVSFEVTNLVRGWVSGQYRNEGVVVKGNKGNSAFAMSESYAVEDRPRLEVCYAVADFGRTRDPLSFR
jgi:hypothetical protein